MPIEVRQVMTAPPPTCRDGRRRTRRSRGIRRLLREARAAGAGRRRAAVPRLRGLRGRVQEAFIAAATQWPREGLPDNPRAWLMHVASAAHHRSGPRGRGAPAPRGAGGQPDPAGRADRAGRRHRRRDRADDTLDLLFMCCHPALSPASAIALTLRAVGGLTTAEIARAFLVPEATMAQRISRAKQTSSVRDGVRRCRPARAGRAPRQRDARALSDVQRGLRREHGQDIIRTDLSGEALRLTRLLARLVPDDTEVAGCWR
jgi:predicted RNA polymerase sigma factor